MIRILGDINFADWYFDQGKGVGSAIANGSNPLSKLPIESEDFLIGNLECVCSDIPDKNYPFVISPSLLSKVHHMNLYGIANNHIMQAGEVSFDQTVKFLEENGIEYAGSKSRRSVTFDYTGKKIGFMAFSMRPDNFTEDPSYWHLPELTEMADELKHLENCDFKIVFVHWGYEFINHPNIEQKQLAHFLIDSGADLIVGMHPHVMQGAELYKGRHIFYSIGNAVFNMAWEPTRYGLMVNIDLSKDNPVIWSEYIKIEDDFFPEIVPVVPSPYTREYLDSLVSLTVENEKYFAEVREKTSEYTKSNRKDIVKRMLTMSPRAQFSLVSDFVKRRFFKQ